MSALPTRILRGQKRAFKRTFGAIQQAFRWVCEPGYAIYRICRCHRTQLLGSGPAHADFTLYDTRRRDATTVVVRTFGLRVHGE
jgi:hypothetical protein